MDSYLRQKYKRGRYILQKEGLFAFFVKGVRFLRRCVFIHESYYTYELQLNEPMKFESTPKIQNSVFEIIATSQRLKDLMAPGFDFGIYGVGAEEKLDKGALMFCIFIGKELACVHWAAATQEAMDSLIKVYYKVDFWNNEAYLGWSETNPKYRRLLLSRYTYSEERKFLASMEKIIGRTLVAKSNPASLKGLPKAGGRVYGEGRYLKILWWSSWKERPVIQQAGQPQSA